MAKRTSVAASFGAFGRFRRGPGGHVIGPIAVIAAAIVSVSASGLPDAKPPEHPFLEFSEPHDYTIKARVNVRTPQVATNDAFAFTTFTFERAAFVFPAVARTAHALSNPDESRVRFLVDDADTEVPVSVLRGYAADSQYLRMDLGEVVRARDITFEVQQVYRCWRPRLREAAAARVEWPDAYPLLVATAITPTIGVDADPIDRAALERGLVELLEGNDPRSARPHLLAKHLMGRVINRLQPSDDGFEFVSGTRGNRALGARAFGLQGIELRGPAYTLIEGRGNPFEIAAVLCGLYKAAGLPARVVVALKEPDPGEDEDFDDLGDTGFRLLRPYVEFYLYDEENAVGGWIPVDPIRQRENSTRPPDLDRPWEYFGNHEQLERFIPFAVHYHPPTTVRSFGSPAFWGMIATPVLPSAAIQTLSFSSSQLPRTTETTWRYREPYEDPGARPGRARGGR